MSQCVRSKAWNLLDSGMGMAKTNVKIMTATIALALSVGVSQPAAAQGENSQGVATQDKARPDAGSTQEDLKVIDELVEQNRQLMAEIERLRKKVAQSSEPDSVAGESVKAVATSSSPLPPVLPPSKVLEAETAEQNKNQRWGTYTPNLGFRLANTDYGDINLSIYTYVRYLNQLGLNSTYNDAFGNVKTLKPRQDFQIQKLQMKFLGWMLNPKLRYFLYAWTSNASQGLGAQVVLAGNVGFAFNKHFSLIGGITSLPGTRSVEGNFPFWLGVDTRLIADEFFRPSYTSGVWAKGEIAKGLTYQVMVGNNLSTLGVSAAQLDNRPDTVASALVWVPTQGDFGVGFGDFEGHQNLAARLGAHFTHSSEDKQSQPNTDSFENTQIRLEDGSVIFTPNLLGPGISVTDVTYKMAAFDGGLKYHGLSLDGEYFLRWLDHFAGPGTAGLPMIFSHGFQMQASAMLKPKMVQVYAGGSTLYGKYGNPWDFRAGTNIFPYKNKVLRWNTEFLYLHKSPVGYTSVPFALGGTGPIFHTNIELAF